MKKNEIMFKVVDEKTEGDTFEKMYPTLAGANGEANNRAANMSAKERKKHHIYVIPVQWSTDESEWAAYDEEEGGFWEEIPCDSEYNRDLIVSCYNDSDPIIEIDHWNDGIYIKVREAISTYIPNDYIDECRNDEMEDFEIVDDIIESCADDMREKGMYLFDYEEVELEKKLAFEIDYM